MSMRSFRNVMRFASLPMPRGRRRSPRSSLSERGGS